MATTDIEWARNLRDQCKVAGVAFFMKQMGARPFRETPPDVVKRATPQDPVGITVQGIYPKIKLKNRKGGNPAEWPEDLRVREFPQTKCKSVKV